MTQYFLTEIKAFLSEQLSGFFQHLDRRQPVPYICFGFSAPLDFDLNGQNTIVLPIAPL
jgi:hypothetical protein